MEHVLTTKLKPSVLDLHDRTNVSDWPHKVDGIPMQKQLKDLCTELRRSYAGFKFFAMSQGSMCNRHTLITIRNENDYTDITRELYADVWVYIAGQDYAVGRIGFGSRYGVKEEANASYVVESREICNKKFNDGRAQYNMIFSKDLKKALKAALANLTPYSAKEMGQLSHHDYRRNLIDERNKVRTLLNDTVDKITHREILIKEVTALIDQGVVFNTPEFVMVASQVKQLVKDNQAIQDKPTDSYYVYVRMVGDEQWVDVVDVPNAWQYCNLQDCTMMSMPMADVPDDIQGRLAVLLMAETDQYMPTIGRRTSDKSFWVER